eukprot:scaffold25864_cov140-Isochrysis_galbana.AAC.3
MRDLSLVPRPAPRVARLADERIPSTVRAECTMAEWASVHVREHPIAAVRHDTNRRAGLQHNAGSGANAGVAHLFLRSLSVRSGMIMLAIFAQLSTTRTRQKSVWPEMIVPSLATLSTRALVHQLAPRDQDGHPR